MTHLTISNGFILDLICSTKDVGLIQTRPRPIVPESMQKNWENEMACQSNTHTHTHAPHAHTQGFTMWISSMFITNESRRNHKEQGDLYLSVTLITPQTLSHTKASGTLYLVPGALETPVKTEVCYTNKISFECPEGSEYQHVIHYKTTQIH